MRKQATSASMIPIRILNVLLILGLILSLTVSSRAVAAQALPSNIQGYACGYHEAVNGVKRLFVWRDSDLSQRSSGEWVDARKDQLQILEVYWSKGSAKIRYPLTNGGYKDRFVPLLALFPTESQNDIKVMKASRRIETYIAMDCSERYGSIAAGDVCYVWSSTPQKNAIRAVYPIGGSKYKLAFFKASDLSGMADVSYLSGSSASSSSSTSGTTKYVVMANPNNRLNMRSGPSSSYSIVAKLSYGTQVQVLSTSGSWSKVSANSKTGYVSSQYLSSTDPKGGSSASTSYKTMSEALYNGSGGRLTCGFNGYTNTKGYHEGIDFKKGYGASVYSLTDGVITRVTQGKNGSSGLSTIAIYSASTGKTVIYLHSDPLDSLYVGQSISRGQKIATEAWRGVSSSSGTHTHVEVRNGRQTSAAKSVGHYVLDNSDPTSFWNSMGYQVK